MKQEERVNCIFSLLERNATFLAEGYGLFNGQSGTVPRGFLLHDAMGEEEP